jgi:SAM-dependent methyltransferase
MGIGIYELQLLQRFRPRGEVLTLGRQNYGVEYAEDLLISLGASAVVSIDYSNFEGATYTGDLNKPVDLGKQFDTIIDFGTTEHVFDIAQALENCVQLCKIGGQIFHAVPANGECGHGFWQMSPELFFSLYSERNGFIETEVFIADLMDERHWWEASRPDAGQRLMANSLTATYVLVHTIKREDRALSVSQPDYEHNWETRTPQNDRLPNPSSERLRNLLKASPLKHWGSVVYRSLLSPTGLTRFNPHLRKVRLDP